MVNQIVSKGDKMRILKKEKKMKLIRIIKKCVAFLIVSLTLGYISEIFFGYRMSRTVMAGIAFMIFYGWFTPSLDEILLIEERKNKEEKERFGKEEDE